MIALGRARQVARVPGLLLVATWRPHSVVVACLLAVCAGGSAPSSAPTLTSGLAPIETGATGVAASGLLTAETATIADGTPTEVYALVARGALGCWFAANGPLKATHIFHADAAPPAHGGGAEIVLHERDASVRDQRGARVFRVALAGAPGGTHVGITVIKVAPALAELMVRDVEVWGRGARRGR